jgi:hypothetical protein
MVEVKAEQNVNEFIKKHGKEGFLKLFFTNYLHELVQYYLHSRGKKGEDTGLLFYVNFRGRAYSPQELDHFRNDLRRACGEKATQIVQKIKELGILERLGEDPLADPKISRILADSLDEIIKELARES